MTSTPSYGPQVGRHSRQVLVGGAEQTNQKAHAHAFPVLSSVCAGFNLEGMYDRVGIYGQGGKHWGELLRGEAPVRRWPKPLISSKSHFAMNHTEIS